MSQQVSLQDRNTRASGIVEGSRVRHTVYAVMWIRGFQGEKIYVGRETCDLDESGCGIILSRVLKKSEYSEYYKCKRCYQDD